MNWYFWPATIAPVGPSWSATLPELIASETVFTSSICACVDGAGWRLRG